MVLLYQDPRSFPADDAGRQKLGEAFEAFTQSVKKAGQFIDGMPLVPMPDQVRTVSGGVAKQGPPESRAQSLIGYYILDYPSIDAAAKDAARIPCAASGSVELVPFMEV
jgi:hypothetical protein